MTDFHQNLAALLKSQPGLSRARIAEALKIEPGEELRDMLDQACDQEIVHKVMDKYYPGSRRAY